MYRHKYQQAILKKPLCVYTPIRAYLFVIAVVIFLPSIKAQNNTEASKHPAHVLESFEDGIPKGLSSTGRSISIDTKRMKHGEQSLRWLWQGNDQLIFDTPIGYHKQGIISKDNMGIIDSHGGSETNPVLEPPRGFFAWVYNLKASQQRMRIQFGRGDIVDCEFDFNLNFKGWRSIAIGYDRGDMRGVPREDMTRVTFNAPTTGSGIFFLDMLGTSVTMNPRTVGPNPQLPNIDQHPRLVAQYPHLLLEYSKMTPSFSLVPMSNDILKDFRIIEEHVKDIYWPKHLAGKNKDEKLAKIKDTFNKFEITNDGDSIYGRPLMYTHIMNDHFAELKLTKKKKFEGMKRWRHDFNYLLRDISNLHYYTQDESVKKELEDMFIQLFDYGVDQGFDAGAGLGWLHHYSYNIREYGPAMYIMRDVLKKHDRLSKAIEICRWFYAVNMVYNEELVYGHKNRVAGNADEIQGILKPRLLSILMQDDSREKERDIRHFSSYYSNIITGYANALDETFKPDGTVFHHAGHAFGYGGRAIGGAAATMYMLSGTEYAATTDSYQRLKKVVESYIYQMFTNKVIAPKAFANIRFDTYELPSMYYTIPAMMALSSKKFDQEMAALFQDLRSKYNKDDEDHAFWQSKLDKKGIETQKYDYTQCKIFPYTCVGINRMQNDYLISVRAHSKYVYPFESWGKSFLAFPLFVANGYLDVSYPKSIDSATPSNKKWYSGFDWHRWPGVTSVQLPYAEMITDPGQVRDEAGEYLFSDQAFSGGVSTSYSCGIYAFQFKGHDKFKLQGFTGKKTYFFVGDKVLCLGSDIQSDLNYHVETTLFQSHLDKPNLPTHSSFNGKVSQFPYHKESSVDSPIWIIDHRDTGFYINDIGSNSSFTLYRNEQKNPDWNNKKEVTGNFATAYINHGQRPTDGSYNYILIAQANEEKMESFAKQMQGKNKPFEVVQQDKIAHVVKLNEESATAYAVYNAIGSSFKKGTVQKVNKQSTFILKEVENYALLSVADPDLNIYDGQDDLLPDGTRCELSIYEREWFFWPSRSNKVQITLKGKWDIKEQPIPMETANQKYAQIISKSTKQTIIEFECKDGLSSEVALVRK
ncbi:chondroitinase family polysaccharide lyase [Labilibacter marinus]|uniref:chondroitinase family polysaccharide lyase n=1 Tax=Labilibacter marinus TaxID=1477105 RepID=UPI00082B9202|nr:chondroitinase family polysaccharide lyase [Labilibacter marinus]